MSTIPLPLGGTSPARRVSFGGILDHLADAFSGPMVAGIGADLFAPPADLSPEEQEAHLDLVASRTESASLLRDALRRSGVQPSTVLGRAGSPVGPGNNRNRRRVLTRLVLALRKRFADAARPLVAGARSLVGWLTGFKRDIAVGHGAATMLAHGTTQPPPGVIATTARWVAHQWAYARNFAGQVATGAHVLGKATLSRAAMYADAAWSHFMSIQLETAKLAGKTQARRILGYAEHCASHPERDPPTMGCVDLADMGWVPIDKVVPIGRATCRSRCHCNITFR